MNLEIGAETPIFPEKETVGFSLQCTYFYIPIGNFLFTGNLWTGPLIVAMFQDLVVPEMFLNYSLVYLHGNRSLSFQLFARNIEQSQSCEETNDLLSGKK
jgi:hypothetical protein